MRKCMWLSIWHIQVIIQIMHMHGAIAETSPWCDMEISYDFVDPEPALNAAALAPLRV